MAKSDQVNHPTAFVKAHQQEAVKDYLEYDGSDRLTKHHTALVDAVTGDACLVTEYQYVGVKVIVQARKEYLGVWDSTWDF